MTTKPLTTEAIALTEKKMDMTLDDIIKMTKPNVSKPKQQRVSNKSQRSMNNAVHDKSAKVRRFLDSRSSLRQAAFVQKRSNFQGNQFPYANEAARKAAVAPIGNRGFNRGKGFNVNRMRVAGPIVQRKTTYGNFNVKPRQQDNAVLKQTQTLDARFANMKEQRMRALSQQNNNNGVRRNSGGPQRQQQWNRGRFFGFF